MATNNMPNLPSDTGANLKGGVNTSNPDTNGGQGENATSAADASMSTFSDGSDDD